MRHFQLCSAALVGALALAAGLSTPTSATGASLLKPGDEYLLAQIERKRDETWRWQSLMRTRRTPSSNSAHRSIDADYRRWVLRLWSMRALTARTQAASPPRKAAWFCIYRHERHPRMGWRTRTGNGFYGGLQMNLEFQRIYGADLLRRKGTAERWSPLEQIWVAERAYRSGRGFYPWPNTARACGLI